MEHANITEVYSVIRKYCRVSFVAPTVPLTSKFTTARTQLAVALCVITSVCIVLHSMCDAQINLDTSNLKTAKETRYLLLFYAQMCVSHAMREGSGSVPAKFD